MYIMNMQSKFVLIQYNVVIIIRHMFCDVQFILKYTKNYQENIKIIL